MALACKPGASLLALRALGCAGGLQPCASLMTWAQQLDACGESEPSSSGWGSGVPALAGGCCGSGSSLLLSPIPGPLHVRRIFNFAGQSDVAKRYHEKKLIG